MCLAINLPLYSNEYGYWSDYYDEFRQYKSYSYSKNFFVFYLFVVLAVANLVIHYNNRIFFNKYQSGKTFLNLFFLCQCLGGAFIVLALGVNPSLLSLNRYPIFFQIMPMISYMPSYDINIIEIGGIVAIVSAVVLMINSQVKIKLYHRLNENKIKIDNVEKAK